MKIEMEALIYHFKIYTEGFAPPRGKSTSVWNLRVASWMLPRERRFAETVPHANPRAVLRESPGLNKMVEGRLIADVIASSALWISCSGRSTADESAAATGSEVSVARKPVSGPAFALIPMLLYAQDQYGHVSDDVIGEIAAAWA